MSGRTFAFGDIHGDLHALETLLSRLPELDRSDTLVFVGDYIDRGPCSAQVIALLRELPSRTPAQVVTLRGNHEDAWLQVVERGWPEFVFPRGNGCLEALRSFQGLPPPEENEMPEAEEMELMLSGAFFPPDVIAWMRSLPHWYEDEHAIYVHAGLARDKAGDGFLHPSRTPVQRALLWCRDQEFFRNYRGKRVVFGHTATDLLPVELSSYTPEDPADLWAGPCTIGLDTRCGRGGFLTAIELPELLVYESR